MGQAITPRAIWIFWEHLTKQARSWIKNITGISQKLIWMTLRKRNIFRPRKIISKAVTLSRLLKVITAEIYNSLLKLATPKSYIMRPISKRRSKSTSKLCWVLPPKQKSPSYDWINISLYVIFRQIIFEGRGWSVNFWALGKILP